MTETAANADALPAAIAEAAVAGGLAPGVRVEGLKRLSGGASKESWAFDLVAPDGAVTQAVQRRQPAELRFSFSMEGGLTTEAAVLRAAHKSRVPVPEVLFELPKGSAAGEGYAMSRIAGLARSIAAGEIALGSPALREHLILTTIDKMMVNQPGYPAFRALRPAVEKS
ncbi:MAG: hypothetical protein KGL48_02720 [Sphingomonadales bacterium]|nr:hypothetical protein [Sphingomonadales bacterium]MDE2568448.1 hypothetical protein [Sphingomonadales bacterium]